MHAVVVTVIHSKGIDAYFHVYKTWPNGSTTLKHSGGLWPSERHAIKQWEEWCYLHPWHDDGSDIFAARRLLDTEQ